VSEEKLPLTPILADASGYEFSEKRTLRNFKARRRGRRPVRFPADASGYQATQLAYDLRYSRRKGLLALAPKQ
jgi:hypothetical protein